MGLFSRSKPQHIDFPALTTKARTSLDKKGLQGRRAAVYLVLDHSVSMRPHYEDGAVQRLATQTLALARGLDDDGTVPTVFFSSHVDAQIDVRLDNYEGIVAREQAKLPWGGTNYAPAMDGVVKDYRSSAASDPALVVFQTDGEPGDAGAAEAALRTYSHLPVFFAFVGFGDSIRFLTQLDDLAGRAVDNASFFHAAQPLAVTDEALYDGITGQFARWIDAATRTGIVR